MFILMCFNARDVKTSSYTALEGMTWREWVDTGGQNLVVDDQGEIVDPDAVIIEGHAYSYKNFS